MGIATKGWFAGAWAMERTVDDRLGGPARLRGTARFVPDGAALYYREDGTLTLAGREFPAHRRYRWLFGPAGQIRVLFADGRPFHAFHPGRPHAQHDCGNDRYQVTYDFDPHGWESRWRVLGPAKDYVMETRYTRL